VGPSPLAENRSIFDDVFVCCQKNVEWVPQLQLEVTADLWKTLVGNYDKSRCPFGEFDGPISESGEGYDNEIRSRLVLAFDQVSN